MACRSVLKLSVCVGEESSLPVKLTSLLAARRDPSSLKVSSLSSTLFAECLFRQ